MALTGAARVTQRSLGQTALQGLQGNLTRLGRLQEQLSSGKAITRPSDSPTGTITALGLRAELRTTGQHERNAQDGLAWLGLIDQRLTGSLDLLNRASGLVLQARNDGSSSPDAKAALAEVVKGLREEMLSVANTRYLDRPVFGGTTAGTQAFDPGTGAYLGDDGAVVRTVGAGTRVRVDAEGPEVFGAGSGSVFAILADVADHIRDDPAALAGDLARLESAKERIVGTLGDVGSRYARVDRARQTAEDKTITMRGGLSEVEDIDLPRTIVELKMQEMGYQAALGATAKVVQPSLLDFLR